MEIADRYTLDREIGRGGMGAVWVGTDQVLGRRVAIKRVGLAPGVGNPDLERAEREARLAARLNHPHVVAVFDLVQEGQEHWLVMEYVDGVTLSELVRRDGALSPDEAAPLLRQTAEALAAAHEVGIVHRDVKPSNILVSADGQVKLSDFGIARAEQDASLTQTGLVTGSPAYLAPEVASGRTATAAADVWSLGATAFHALSGRPPYEVGDNIMGALYRIVHEEPPRLAEAGWLTAMLEHTMTREPGARWPMARVRDFLGGGPLAAATVPASTGTTTTVVEQQPPEPGPGGPLDDGGTRVLAPTPAPLPPPLAPPLAPPPALRQGPGGAAIGVVIALGVVLLFLLFAWLFGAFDPQDGSDDDSSSPPATSSSGNSEDSPSTSTADPARAEAMQAFLASYVAAAVDDPKTSWEMLTPGFQEASGGFGRYKKYWDQWESAAPANIEADPESLTVTYDITYSPEKKGDPVSDHVTLQLAQNGDGFLIAAER